MKSQDSSVSIVTGCRLDDQISIPVGGW